MLNIWLLCALQKVIQLKFMYWKNKLYGFFHSKAHMIYIYDTNLKAVT